jgi:hypothetical protein
VVRAAFYGGAAGHVRIQVFGLLAWEALALFAIVMLRPFESNRLNLLMVCLLGISKVSTVALSSAFDPQFGLQRITTTIIGVVIIVIQGLLTVCLLVAIVLGAVSSYMSVTRYQETINPRSLSSHRGRYLAHVDQKATDRPKPPSPHPRPATESPKEPYFLVSAVRRELKIEDENGDMVEEPPHVRTSARPSTAPEKDGEKVNASRSQSMRSRASGSNLPFGARSHRASWSTHDFKAWTSSKWDCH